MLHKSPKDLEMSDAALAHNIIAEAFDLRPGNRSRVIAAAYEAVKAIERALPRAVIDERGRQWTERRIRTFVDEEATRVDHYEIMDLKAAALEEAKRELYRSRQRAARMAAYLATSDADFHGDEIERMGAFARGVDMPGVVCGGEGE